MWTSPQQGNDQNDNNLRIGTTRSHIRRTSKSAHLECRHQHRLMLRVDVVNAFDALRERQHTIPQQRRRQHPLHTRRAWPRRWKSPDRALTADVVADTSLEAREFLPKTSPLRLAVPHDASTASITAMSRSVARFLARSCSRNSVACESPDTQKRNSHNGHLHMSHALVPWRAITRVRVATTSSWRPMWT